MEKLEKESYCFRNENHSVIFWRKDGTPEYSIKDAIFDYNSNKKIKFVYFWGHQPSKNGEITKTCLSQWWLANFSVNGEEYFCMEQYMMAEKAKLFGDREILKEIMQSKFPKQIKALGRKVKNFDEKVWDKCKYSIVLNGNYEKFIQNSELKKFLISTNDRILVEASPFDAVWGIKMGIKDENIENPNKWQGKNLLGFALMEVRNKLKKNEILIN